MKQINGNGAVPFGSDWKRRTQQAAAWVWRAAVVVGLAIVGSACSPRVDALPALSSEARAAMHAHLALDREAAAQPRHLRMHKADTVAHAEDTRTSIYRTVTVLPTYAVETYQTPQVDPTYNWPYQRFDRERFLLDAPEPVNRAYEVVILENEWLRMAILPELGGRIWQVIHKPTGLPMFYQNTVVKPSPWGPVNQLGWTGLGGLEWNLPVVEHGYDWGTPWTVETFHSEDGAAVARLSTPDDGRYLAASIDVRLPPDGAYFEIEPHIQNISDAALDFDYWHNAMLAPGTGYRPSPELRFVLPGEAVRVHSTGDERLPGPDSVMPWPHYRMRDMSHLGEWDQYLGFFEYPAAHGPYAGVYEPTADMGAVRVYPAETAQGSKVFGLGWNDALASEYYADDGSAYVELHGGLTPTFSQRAHLESDESVQWSERWYPVHGIGRFTAANDAGALAWQVDSRDGSDAATQTASHIMSFGFYPSEAFAGEVVVSASDGREIARRGLHAAAGVPVTGQIELTDDAIVQAGTEGLTVQLEDAYGALVLSSTVVLP